MTHFWLAEKCTFCGAEGGILQSLLSYLFTLPLFNKYWPNFWACGKRKTYFCGANGGILQLLLNYLCTLPIFEEYWSILCVCRKICFVVSKGELLLFIVHALLLFQEYWLTFGLQKSIRFVGLKGELFNRFWVICSRFHFLTHIDLTFELAEKEKRTFWG